MRSGRSAPPSTSPPSPLAHNRPPQFQGSGSTTQQAQREAEGAAAEREAALEALERELETAVGQRQQLQQQLEEAEDKVGWWWWCACLGGRGGEARPI
jgi:hypothetical protein